MDAPAIGDEADDDLVRRRRPPRREQSSEAGGAAASESGGAEGGAPADGAPDAERDEAERAPEETAPSAPVERRPPPRKERKLPGGADLERHAVRAVERGRGGAIARERRPLGARPQRVEDPAVVLQRLVGPDRARTLGRKLQDAGKAFAAERFGDARTLLRPVVKEAPSLPDGRELLGLTLYRLGKWQEAIEHLEAFRELTDSTEQHPVLADCHRALGRVADVEYLWDELGEASPSGELVTEGRIVLAGTHADQGDLAKAIRTLQAGWKLPKRPREQHLRRAYALADLYDRAGKTARARELFKWVARHEPRFSDVTTRVKQLS
jgi:Flp pilus assembly protein TadD